MPANGLLTAPSCLVLMIGLHDVELLAPLGEVLGRQLGEVVVVELPGRVVAPALRRLHRGARAGRGLQHAQRQLQRLRLRLGVVRACRPSCRAGSR